MILSRHYVAKPWGRTDLPNGLGGGDERIGEILYDRDGAPLPVLVKWIFTSECLSIQVHPCDEHARSRGLAGGKEEYWIVTHAEPGAVLGIGTKEEVPAEALRTAALDGSIRDLIDWKPVQPGDWYCIPPGTVHAIGAGVTLVEVQPNVDASYRLYDHGRTRDLHVEEAISVAVTSAYRGDHGRLNFSASSSRISTGAKFTIHACRGPLAYPAHAGPCLLVPVEGRLEVGGASLDVGDVGYFDETMRITGTDGARYLLVEVASKG